MRIGVLRLLLWNKCFHWGFLFSWFFFLSQRLAVPPFRIGGMSVLLLLGSVQAKQNQTYYFSNLADQTYSWLLFPVPEENQYWNIRVIHTVKILIFQYPAAVKSAQGFWASLSSFHNSGYLYTKIKRLNSVLNFLIHTKHCSDTEKCLHTVIVTTGFTCYDLAKGFQCLISANVTGEGHCSLINL